MIEAQSDKDVEVLKQKFVGSNNKNIENQQFDFKSIKNAEKPSIIHVILLNRTLRILCSLGIFCALIPLADYFYFYSTQIVEHQTDDSGICSHYPIYQIPCGVENVSMVECIDIACCYSSKTGCYHFLPSKYQYRREVKSNQPSSDTFQYLTTTRQRSPLNTTTVPRIKIEIQEITEDILSLSLWNSEKITSSETMMSSNNEEILSKNFQYKVFFSPEMFVEVKRRSDGKNILSTSRGALIVSEGYFEWSFYLGNSEDVILMGFGELELKPGQILLISTVIPFIIAYDRKSKQYHAVYFESLNSPTEVEILKSNVIVIRQFYSSSFELKLFIGPSYDDIYRQLTKHMAYYTVEERELWTLGIHICYYLSASSTFLNITEAQIELDHLLSNENVKSIPFDSHCLASGVTSNVISSQRWQNAIELFGVEFIERLRARGKKVIFHVSFSAVEIVEVEDEKGRETNNNEFYQRAIDGKLFLRDHDGGSNNFIGTGENMAKVSYLDYITKSQEITDLLSTRWKELSETNFLNFTNGIFIEKSYPQDETPNKSLTYLNEFKFKPRNFESYVMNHAPLNLRSSLNDEMLIHQLNNFARWQTRIFQSINNDDKKFCITDSFREDSECAVLIKESNPGWKTFKSVVYKSVWHSLIGVSFYGSEVCGSSDENIREDLCIRWYQFAIFSPLFYVKADKTPLKFSKYSTRIMTRAIQTRYMFLQYMKMHLIQRIPLLKPLRLVYPHLSYEIEKLTKHQFMFGESLLISPVIEPLIRHVDLYFPEKYFEFWSGFEMPYNTSHFSVVMHDIPIFIRAGHIVAVNLAYESMSAEDATKQPFLLFVALNCSSNSCHSQGRLVVDEKNLLEFNFQASENHLNISVITRNPNEASRNAICDPERRSTTGEFLLAKIYGLREFKKEKNENLNDYLSLDLNICTENETQNPDKLNKNKTFSFSF